MSGLTRALIRTVFLSSLCFLSDSSSADQPSTHVPSGWVEKFRKKLGEDPEKALEFEEPAGDDSKAREFELKIFAAEAMAKAGHTMAAQALLSETALQNVDAQASQQALSKLEVLARDQNLDDDALEVLALQLDQTNSFVAWYRSRALQRRGHADWAMRELGKIESDSVWSPQSAETRSRFADASRRRTIERLLADGDHKRAIAAMKSLAVVDRAKPSVMLDLAWSYYNLKDDGRSLGVLAALGSKYFEDLQTPEVDLLKMMIEARLCRSDLLKSSYEDFRSKYAATFDLIGSRRSLEVDERLKRVALARPMMSELTQRLRAYREDLKWLEDARIRFLDGIDEKLIRSLSVLQARTQANLERLLPTEVETLASQWIATLEQVQHLEPLAVAKGATESKLTLKGLENSRSPTDSASTTLVSQGWWSQIEGFKTPSKGTCSKVEIPKIERPHIEESIGSGVDTTRTDQSSSQQKVAVKSSIDAMKSQARSIEGFRTEAIRLAKERSRLGQWAESSEAWAEVVSLSATATDTYESVQRWSEAIQRAPYAPIKTSLRLSMLEAIVRAAQDFRIMKLKASSSRIAGLELVARDIATRIQQTARDTENKNEFIEAARAYELFRFGFPQSTKLSSVILNRAESLFRAEKWTLAGREYEELIRFLNSKVPRDKRRQDDLKLSAIQSYVNALKNSKEPSSGLRPVDRLRARRAIRELGTEWIQTHMRHEAAPSIAYNIGQSWYDDQFYKESIQAFEFFLKSFGQSPKKGVSARDAVFMTINAFAESEDLKGLIEAAPKFERVPGLTKEDRETISESIRKAKFKTMQSAAGEYGSSEYAKKMIAIATQSKDEKIGLVALKDAFYSLKESRDFEMYKVGETIFTRFSDSSVTKEIASVMAKTALLTGDFDRAARYFQSYSSKFPKEAESKDWSRTAAEIFEVLGEYRKARSVFLALGDIQSVARMDQRLGDWKALEQTASRMKGAERSYLMGLAQWRLGKKQDAVTNLTKAVGGDPDASTHSRFLLAQSALDKFQKIQMRDASDQKALVEKVKAFRSLSDELTINVKQGSGRWMIASMFLLGQINSELSRFILESPTPKGLKPEELEVYKKELVRQARVYRVDSIKQFRQCLERAEQSEIFTRYAIGCRERGQNSIPEEADVLIVSPSDGVELSPPAAVNISELRLKLWENPKDVSTLLLLGETYLLEKQPWKAISIFNRALEVGEKSKVAKASAHAGIGVASLYLGDFARASAELHAALKIQTRQQTAVWNLLGLYREFRYRNRYRELRPSLSSKTKPKLLHPVAEGAQRF